MLITRMSSERNFNKFSRYRCSKWHVLRLLIRRTSYASAPNCLFDKRKEVYIKHYYIITTMSKEWQPVPPRFYVLFIYVVEMPAFFPVPLHPVIRSCFEKFNVEFIKKRSEHMYSNYVKNVVMRSIYIPGNTILNSLLRCGFSIPGCNSAFWSWR